MKLTLRKLLSDVIYIRSRRTRAACLARSPPHPVLSTAESGSVATRPRQPAELRLSPGRRRNVLAAG